MTLPDDKLAHFAQPDCGATWCRKDVHAMAVELMERRAADLKAFDRMVLEVARDRLVTDDTIDRSFIAVLDKLLGGAR